MEVLGRGFDEVQAKWRPVLGLTPIGPPDDDGVLVEPEAGQ